MLLNYDLESLAQRRKVAKVVGCVRNAPTTVKMGWW